MNYRELAKYFNISPSAFSIIVNNKPGVSDATRNRVITELRAMGYGNMIKEAAPAAPARQNLLFIVFKKDGAILDMQPFFMLLIENIETAAQKYGYNIMLSTLDLRRPISEQISRINSINAAGAIVFATEMADSDIDVFSSFEKPYLILDNYFAHIPVNTVAINNEMGTWQAVTHLIEMGHTRIGYLAAKSRISSFCEREEGYRKALSQYGLALDEKDIYRLSFTEEGSYRDFSDILKGRPDLPTGFVTDDDTIALGVMRALRENGYSIPDDISLVGFNDRPVCEISIPPLTTINVSKNTFAAEAVDAVAALIDDRKDPERAGYRTKKTRVETWLSVRDSVKNLRDTQ